MTRQPTIVGNPVLLVIDIQKSAFMEVKAGIPVMPGYRDHMERARSVVDAAHDNGIPVVFIQEIHRRDMVDYGRELDGSEDIHCMEGEPGTPATLFRTAASIAVFDGRSPRGARMSVRDAWRTSPELSSPAWPIVVKTLSIPSTRDSARRTCSLVSTVVCRAVPGGSSIDISVRLRSSDGRKPTGIRGNRASEAARNARVAAMVALGCARHQRTVEI